MCAGVEGVGVRGTEGNVKEGPQAGKRTAQPLAPHDVKAQEVKRKKPM